MQAKKAKFIDIDYNTVFDISKEPTFYDEEAQELVGYWTDGKRIYWGTYIVEADIDSFVYFNRLFAKDKKNCFLQAKTLRNTDCETFEALNNCFAKDKNSVWTTGGRFEPADIKTFEVCDDGICKPNKPTKHYFKDNTIKELFIKIPYGYAKDAQNVYYENFQGKIKVLNKVNTEMFCSNNDGYYGWDDKNVFYGKNILPKANPKTWRIIDENGLYSKDDKSIFYLNKRMTDVDYGSFVVPE